MSYGTGTYGSGVYGSSDVAILVREKPPLRLSHLVTTPSGRRYRWSEDEPDPRNVPSGVRCSSTMPGGFESHDLTLPRKPGSDAPDLERLSTLQTFGPGGEVVWEGRLERAPKVSGDQMAISPSAAGYQAALEDNQTVRIIYRDNDLTKWSGLSVQRKLDLLNSNIDAEDAEVTPDTSTGVPSLQTGLTGTWDRAHRTEGYYNAQGLDIADLAFAWKKGATVNAADTNWTWQAFLSLADTVGSVDVDVSGNLRAAGPGSGTVTATGSRKFAGVQLIYSAASGASTGGMLFPVYWTLAVYGDHGLAVRGTEPDAGFYASDVIPHAVTTFAPSLKLGDIESTGFLIPQLVFTDSTTVSEIIKQANRFHLNDWAVWEDKTFVYHSRGAKGKRWQAWINPSQLEETGPQIDRLYESVVVSFTDVDGTTKTVGPPGSGADIEDAQLKDLDPENPANKLGITRRSLLQMGTSTPAGAIQVGARFLQEQKLLDSSGRAQLVGHVSDDRGVLHPAWEVRAGDYIVFLNASDTSPRRIVKSDYEHSTRTTSVDLDSPPEGLQELLERLGVVLTPLGLS